MIYMIYLDLATFHATYMPALDPTLGRFVDEKGKDFAWLEDLGGTTFGLEPW